MGQRVETRLLYGVLYHRNDDDAVVLSRNRKSSGRLGSENRLAQPFGCKPRRRRPIVKEAPVIITHNGAEGPASHRRSRPYRTGRPEFLFTRRQVVSIVYV